MKIKILDYGGKLPQRKHYNDAGADVYPAIEADIYPESTMVIPLGIGLKLPDGYAAFVYPRSSWSSIGVTCELAPIDSGYTGEIHAIVTNHSQMVISLHRDTAIGQLVILPIVIAQYDYELGDERKDNWNGSTNNVSNS